MNLREPTAADGSRIAELVESAMTASYRLSPAQIEALVEAEFSTESIAAKVERDGTLLRVVEVGGEAGFPPDERGIAADESVIVGYVEGQLRDSGGEVRWLFVDPEHRGLGIGTSAFDAAVEVLTDAGAVDLVAASLEANAEGGEFFDSLGFERVDERTVDVADDSLHAEVYAEPGSRRAGDATTANADGATNADEVTGADGVIGADGATDADGVTGADGAADGEGVDDGDPAGSDDQLPDDPRDLDLPETERVEGTTTARTDSGKRVVLAFEEMESGTDAPFFATYLDSNHEHHHGYYCSNCGSLSVPADTTDRIECQACGNDHAERSSDAYDGAYL